jgi:hypothetical protein
VRSCANKVTTTSTSKREKRERREKKRMQEGMDVIDGCDMDVIDGRKDVLVYKL